MGSQLPSSDSLHEQLTQFIQSRPSLMQDILLYQPLWLKSLARDVKEAGIKCKVAQLQDWLDIQCITFRTESSRNRNKVNKEQGSEVGNKRDKKKRKKESEEMLADSDA